eukprot:2088054-Karenia_brevis.AAC.1
MLPKPKQTKSHEQPTGLSRKQERNKRHQQQQQQGLPQARVEQIPAVQQQVTVSKMSLWQAHLCAQQPQAIRCQEKGERATCLHQ